MLNKTWEQAVRWLREQPDQQELVQACYYDDPLLDAAKRFSESEEWQAVRGLLPKAGRALDLGAGRGIGSYALAAGGWQVTALEPDSSDLVGAAAIRTLARESGLPITVVQGLAEEMDLGSGVFDLVYTREVLHHARDLRAMCRQAARALAPGGIFLACREHVINTQNDLDTFLKAHPLHRYYGGENAYTLDEYLSAIGSSGLHMEKIYGPYDSVINYFPAQPDDLLGVIYQPLQRFFNGKLVSFLMKSRWVRRVSINPGFLRFASWRDRTPGRLYTFLAVKPR
jgi:2-polyprenyl-3-methyl-5-hydroxy-6-metoxy-1,4-benzoquinol methylase